MLRTSASKPGAVRREPSLRESSTGSVGLVTRRCGGGVLGVAHVSQDGARAAAEVPKFHPWRTLISATTRPSRTMVRVMSASSVSGTCALVAHRVRQRCAATPAPSERARGQVLRQPSTWVDTLSVQPVWIYPVADLRSYMVHGGAAAAAGDEGTVRGVGMAQVQDRRRGGCGRRCGYRPATEGAGSTVATISQRTQVVEERVDRPEGTVGIAVFGLHHVLEERPRRL